MTNKALIARLKKSRKTSETSIKSALKSIERLGQSLEEFQADTEKGVASANDLISIYESKISGLDSQIQDALND